MKITLDTDTRQVRKLPTGHYQSGAGKRICDHCGLRNDCGFEPYATHCQWYLPAIPFTGDTGMEDTFNTVRVGKAWVQRLDPNQIVMLYNSQRKEVIGYAKVLLAHSGPIIDILKLDAHANHLMLTTPKREAPAALGSWLRQNYGPRIIHENTTLTAIYLQRVNTPPEAPSASAP